jgi:hypothetical protein
LQFRDVLRAISASVPRHAMIWWAFFLPDPDGYRLQTFVLDFPESKGSIREEYCSIEGSLGGFIFRTGKPWRGNASGVFQLDLKDKPAIPEGLKPVASCRLLAGIAKQRLNEDLSRQTYAHRNQQVVSDVRRAYYFLLQSMPIQTLTCPRRKMLGNIARTSTAQQNE